MAAPRRLLRVQLPQFGVVHGRPWRKAVHTKLLSARRQRGVRFARGQPVAVTVTVNLRPAHLKKVDIDNVLKHVLDALQGVLAGEGKKRAKLHKRIVLNDNLVWSATVEKRRAPRKRSAGGGWLTVRPWRNARG